ncbi:MAG: SAM-dependent chlorinase/fluorinase [Prevotellaceae bacterium]|jgi:S-adenosylmethionine hydrolase|nr:SAM-dependent chlorinase/fluorinase [Prevotellaceae bacterium]
MYPVEHNGQQIITLTTDWNNAGYYFSAIYDQSMPSIYPVGEHYVAQLKGILMHLAPRAAIIDISHRIQAFNAVQAAHVVRQVYRLYPEGTLHIIGVNSEPSPRNKIVVICKNNHIFAGANDGIFGMIFDGEPDLIVELQHDEKIHGFAALKLFAQIVKCIVDKRELAELGKPCEMKRDLLSKASFDEFGITGTVIFIDSFGNLITNISRELFENVGKNRPFNIYLRSPKDAIDRISQYYDDVPEHYRLALFNSDNMLELAIRNCNLAQLEHIDTRSLVRVSFDGTRLFY